MRSTEETARLFGQYLDEDRFDAVLELLIDDCEYDIGNQLLTDKESIVNLYKTNMEEGHQKFDHLEWGKSRVKKINDHLYEVYFSDFLTHKGETHNYNCKQLLSINARSLIFKIEHVELEGEREKLNAFYKRVGLA
jgi:hypothetical protein